MNAYPRLSEDAYSDEEIHHKEVIEMIVEEAADMWRYYKGNSLTPKKKEELQKALEEKMRHW